MSALSRPSDSGGGLLQQDVCFPRGLQRLFLPQLSSLAGEKLERKRCRSVSSLYWAPSRRSCLGELGRMGLFRGKSLDEPRRERGGGNGGFGASRASFFCIDECKVQRSFTGDGASEGGL